MAKQTKQSRSKTTKSKKASKTTASKEKASTDEAVIEDGTDGGGSSTDKDPKIQDIGYHPFDTPIKERPYTKPKVDPAEVQKPLEVPTFEAPSLDELEAMDEQNQEFKAPSGGGSMPSDDQPPQFNPAFNDLPKKDKQSGAEAMADVTIDGYSRLKMFMSKIATISETKLDREIADGAIDPDLQLPIDEIGNTATLKEFTEEWNNEVKEVCETSDEFKEEVKPMLVEEYMKRGVGMTNMQKLLYTTGMDFTTTTVSLFQLRNVGTGMMNSWKELSSQGGYTNPVRSSDVNNEAEYKQEPMPSNDQQNDQNHEQEYVEPEEMQKKQEDGAFAPAVVDESMPDFGDPDLLEDMQKLAEREAKKNNSKKKQK